MKRKQMRWAVAALLAVGVLGATSALARPYVSYLWLSQFGQQAVFWTLLRAHLACLAAGFVVGTTATYASLLYAERRWPGQSSFAGPVKVEVRGTRVIVLERGHFPRWLIHLAAFLAGLITAASFYGLAMPGLMLVHRQPFGMHDPLFGRDASFYVFVIPFVQRLIGGLDAALLVVGVITLAYYAARGYRAAAQTGRLPASLPRHAALFVAAFLLLRVPALLLARWDLVVNGTGLAGGAGYVDAVVRSPGLIVMALACLGVAVWLVAYRRYRHPGPFLAATGGLILLGLVGLALIPAAVEAWVVRPNEIAVESPYIQHALSMTRTAFGLDTIAASNYPVKGTVKAQGNRATLSNIRLWDPAPLKAAYQQLQSLKPYYRFHDVDVDRYRVKGHLRQVMLAAREVPLDLVGKSWVKRRLKYTHGYGVALSPVTDVTPEGQPI